MVRVKLGGRELRIEDYAVAEYLKKGYSVIDDNGNVIQKGDVITFNQAVEENKKLRMDIDLYRLQMNALSEENEALKAEIEALKAEIEALKASAAAEKKATKKAKSE